MWLKTWSGIVTILGECRVSTVTKVTTCWDQFKKIPEWQAGKWIRIYCQYLILLSSGHFPRCCEWPYQFSLWNHNRILPPCNYCHHPWCVGHKSYHKALLIMFSCDGMSDHAIWNEAFHYWDTKLSRWWDITLFCCTCCKVYTYTLM